MATIKICTDIPQSKVLAEFLPPESADMLYYCNKSNNIQISQYPFIRSFKEKDTFSYLPCWSLAALLSVLPDDSEDKQFLTLQKEDNEYCCCYEDINGDSFRHTFANNAIDACYEMILKLHELNLL